MIDHPIARARQQTACGKRVVQVQALEASRGGLSTKIPLVVDAKGQPVLFILTGGQAHDAPMATPLLAAIKATHVIADKGYHMGKFLGVIHPQETISITPPKSKCKTPDEYDRGL